MWFWLDDLTRYQGALEVHDIRYIGFDRSFTNPMSRVTVEVLCVVFSLNEYKIYWLNLQILYLSTRKLQHDLNSPTFLGLAQRITSIFVHQSFSSILLLTHVSSCAETSERGEKANFKATLA